MPNMIKIAIAEFAKSRGIETAYQLQKLTDLPTNHVHKLWKGEFKMIGIETLDALCRALKCKPNDILVCDVETAKPTRKAKK